METLTCDVLVLGGGGAGVRAALAAQEILGSGHRVILATKGRLGKSGVTAVACSDRMAFHATLPYTEPQEPNNWLYHAEDIYRLGGYVSDADLAMILARESARAVEYLAGLGVPFVRRPDGRFDQFLTDGSVYARALYTGPFTAVHIEQALVRELCRHPVQVLEDAMAVDLLLDAEGRAAGAWLLDCTGSQWPPNWLEVRARAVVLATGGAGEAFAVHVFPPGQTGDGYALAYRAGAPLVNMELIQIGPSSVITGLACSGSLMRAVPRLINDQGEEFLARYLPPGTSAREMGELLFRKGTAWPISYENPSHLIDVAMAREILAGRRVYLDYTCNPEGFRFAELPAWIQEAYRKEAEAAAAGEREGRKERRERKAGGAGGDRETSPLERLREINPPIIRWFAARGVKLEEGEPVEVAPAIQHFQGGVKIRRRGETAVPGLFAAGEVAGGQHGANRPGGNALLDCQVFGRLAGEAAARLAAEGPPGPPRWAGGRIPVEEYLERLAAELEAPEGLAAGRARARIQELCYRSAGVIRSPQGLEEGLRGLAELRRRGIRLDEEGPARALEVRNLLLVAEAVLRSALTRRESRGPHLFFPDGAPGSPPLPRDEGWNHRYVVVRPPSLSGGPAALGEGMVVTAERTVSWEEALSDLAAF